jgi:hypothetical protein
MISKRTVRTGSNESMRAKSVRSSPFPRDKSRTVASVLVRMRMIRGIAGKPAKAFNVKCLFVHFLLETTYGFAGVFRDGAEDHPIFII